MGNEGSKPDKSSPIKSQSTTKIEKPSPEKDKFDNAAPQIFSKSHSSGTLAMRRVEKLDDFLFTKSQSASAISSSNRPALNLAMLAPLSSEVRIFFIFLTPNLVVVIMFSMVILAVSNTSDLC